MNEFLPESLSIVANGEHGEFLVGDLVLRPVLLESMHVRSGQAPRGQRRGVLFRSTDGHLVVSTNICSADDIIHFIRFLRRGIFGHDRFLLGYADTPELYHRHLHTLNACHTQLVELTLRRLERRLWIQDSLDLLAFILLNHSIVIQAQVMAISNEKKGHIQSCISTYLNPRIYPRRRNSSFGPTVPDEPLIRSAAEDVTLLAEADVLAVACDCFAFFFFYFLLPPIFIDLF